ncbi:MAG TPA: hypothetical protein DCZ34_01040 [Clostridiales bacterium]|nr:hypothetical protein [Clostridiales bacterium]
MAIVNLTNQTTIEGQYGSPASAISFVSNEVTTSIVQGLIVQKEADKTNWVNGPLTYTIVVTNNSGNTLSSGSLIDKIDTTLVDFSTTYGVQIDGSKTSNYTYNDGNLQVTLPDLETDKSVTITFQVTQK